MHQFERKSISFIFFLGILLMLAHGVVPHHHHSHPQPLHEEEDCHSENENGSGEHEDTHNAPFHCHAFNDSDWFNQEQSNRVVCYQLIAFVFSYTSFDLTSINYKSFVEPQFVFRERLFCCIHNSRPPPVLS